MPVTLQASSSASTPSHAPDGSIGIKLIRQFNFSIDLPQKELRLFPREVAGGE
jgi:hypothetical protein